MQVRNDSRRYGAVAQALHWVIALGFVAQFGIAWYMDDLPFGPAAMWWFNFHKSIGMTLLALAVLRLAWRAFNPPPPLPAGRPAWEYRAARASHIALYGVLFAQPLTGLTFSLFSEFPNVIWGYTLPNPGHVEWVKDIFMAAHVYLSWVVIALVAIHAGAALRHHFVEKDDVLIRMLPLRRRSVRNRQPGAPAGRADDI